VSPYISFVVVGRNDNYGGAFLDRINVFVKNLLTLSERYALPSELVIVEWNPPRNNPGLKDAVAWPDFAREFCAVRIVEVPYAVHRGFAHAEKMPIFEYIGKNAGVRRASGTFVLVTNPDTLFSSGLIRRMAERDLAAASYYRTARYDVYPPVPVDGSVDEQLTYCRRHITMELGYFGCWPWTFERLNPYARLLSLAAHVKLRIRNRSLSAPYDNASGDFFLMHRAEWAVLRGFPEFRSQTYIDSYLAYMAHSSGYRLRIFKGRDVFLFHQDHSRGERRDRPLTDLDRFYRDSCQMMRQRKPMILNDDSWGLRDVPLPEYQF
jgi:hypothetical protein